MEASMYSEQLAILLFVAAQGLAQQGAVIPGQVARLPRGGAEPVSVNLKLDPRLNSYRNPYTGKWWQKRVPLTDALFASND
jgi:hypothetical protein